MLIRLLLSLVFFWAIIRFGRAVARAVKQNRPRPDRTVHTKGSRDRNPLKGGRVIDVDFTEKADSKGEDKKS